MILLICTLLLLAWEIVALVLRIVFTRKNGWRIRDWARDNGYAILRMHYERSILRAVVFYIFGWVWLWVCPFPAGGAWYVSIQDEQGGLREGHIHFGNTWVDIPGGKMLFEWR